MASMQRGNADRPPRFRINLQKCIEGVDYLAARQPGITQFYVCKVFFFADKQHLLDWGRPISGDRFVAMEHGPVPSFIYDLLKDASVEPDEIIDELSKRVTIVKEGNRLKLYSKGVNRYDALSETDMSCLQDALQTYGRMPFPRVKQISHADPAYEQAWSQPGLNNEMDISLWFGEDERAAALDDLEEKIKYSVAMDPV